jgi:hypothetical protein
LTYPRILAGWLLLGGWPAGDASAQQAAAPEPQPLQAVLDRIHIHAAGDKWRQDGFADPLIEAWLDKLMGSLAAAAEMPDLKLPVRLADVQAADLVPDGDYSRALVVGQDIDLKHSRLRNSIILADGKVNLDRAEGCVIVARGAVTVGLSEYCVIASGVFVDVARFDGQPGNTSNGSVIASRGWASVQSAYGSLIAANEGSSTSRAQGAWFVNAAVVGRLEGRTLRVADLPLEPLPAHPFAQAIRFQGIVRGDGGRYSVRTPVVAADGSESPGHLGIVFRHDARRYVAQPDKPILDETGQPAAALRDWRVTLITPALAIFSNGTSDVAVPLEGR